MPSRRKEPRRRKKGPPPMHQLLDLLGERWTLRILWELSENGPLTFQDLRKQCGDIQANLLNSRLRKLRNQGLVALQKPEGYFLTRAASELSGPMKELQRWARRWVRRQARKKSGKG